jgi:pilus assembly protein Flp/PilA
MNSLAAKLLRFLVTEDGPTAVEYSVMLAMNVLVSISAIRLIGTTTSSTFDEAAC